MSFCGVFSLPTRGAGAGAADDDDDDDNAKADDDDDHDKEGNSPALSAASRSAASRFSRSIVFQCFFLSPAPEDEGDEDDDEGTLTAALSAASCSSASRSSPCRFSRSIVFQCFFFSPVPGLEAHLRFLKGFWQSWQVHVELHAEPDAKQVQYFLRHLEWTQLQKPLAVTALLSPEGAALPKKGAGADEDEDDEDDKEEGTLAAFSAASRSAAFLVSFLMVVWCFFPSPVPAPSVAALSLSADGDDDCKDDEEEEILTAANLATRASRFSRSIVFQCFFSK